MPVRTPEDGRPRPARGVTEDLTVEGASELRALVDRLRVALPRLQRLHDETPALQDRIVTTGILRPDLAKRFGAEGFVGRAPGRDFDSRRDLAYAQYDVVPPTVPDPDDGAVNARIDLAEGDQGQPRYPCRLLDQIPPGPSWLPYHAISAKN